MSDDPDVSVLIVTYECEAFIEACLDSVTDTTVHHRVELVVADNASADDSVGAIRRAHPEARIIEMGGNTGFAKAVNAAMAASTGRLVLLLNPDTEVQPGAIDVLADELDAHPEVGIVAPRLLNRDGTDQGTARSLPTPAAALLGRRSPLTRAFPGNRWSRRYLIGRRHGDDQAFDVDWVSGACLMARRDEALAVGGLDEGFFMHFEDADFCRRMADRGLAVRCVPSSQVVHHEGGSRLGWPASQVGHFHYGAYRFWTKHHAPQRWNPLRPAAALALGLRAVAVIATNRITGKGAARPSVPDAPAPHAPTTTKVMQP